MTPALKAAISQVQAMAECSDPVEALSALELAFKLKPESDIKAVLGTVRATLKSGHTKRAIALLDTMLTNACVERQKTSYVNPKSASLMKTLYYTMRGVAKPKEENGTIRIPFEPKEIQHVIFLNQGTPFAIALCTSYKPQCGDWIVGYDNVQWLQNAKS